MRRWQVTGPEAHQPEPPAYLQGALRAAAAARARTARIRAAATAFNRASEDPVEAAGPAIKPGEDAPADLAEDGREAPGSRADPTEILASEGDHHSRARHLSFARTVAAAHQARSAVASEGAGDPWHLCLRAESGARDGPWRRWFRLLKPLRWRRKSGAPASELLSLGYRAGVLRQPDRAAPLAPVGNPARGEVDIPLEGSWPRAGPTLPAPGAPEPAAPGVLRLPPLGQRRFDPKGLPSGAPPDPGGRRSPAPADLSWAAHPHPIAPVARRPQFRTAAEARRGVWRGLADDGTGPSGRAALAAPWGSRLSSDGRPARREAAPRSQALVATVAAEPLRPRLAAHVQRAGLPMIVQRADLSGVKLLACEPRPDSAQRGSGSSRGSATRPPRPSPQVARKRVAVRLAALGFAIVGGFGLGIVANGGALVTGSKLGEVMLALEAQVFGRAAEAPPASSALPLDVPAPRPATGDGVRPAPSAPQLAASAGSIAESRAPVDAASRVQSPPRAAAARRPDGAAGTSERTTAAATTGPRAAASGWEALYAQGHRYQLQGNLVAAADAYRRALRLNPYHPAMLYDLGYVLQIQGQSDAAMAYYRRTIALEPDHAYAHYNLGYLLQEQGDSTAASRHYEIAAARLPGNPYTYYDWAWSLETAGDLAGAAALYRKAIEIDPDRRPGSDARRRLAALGLPVGAE